MEFFRNGLFKLSIPDEIKKRIDVQTSYMIENVGIPQKIVYAEINFVQAKIVNDKYLEFGYDKNLPDYRYGIDINSNNVIMYNVVKSNEYYLVINKNIESLIMISFCNDFFIKRLILSESLGAYYDNSLEGGNFKKYATLLKNMILDIDNDAAHEGAWFSLIEEMMIGAI